MLNDALSLLAKHQSQGLAKSFNPELGKFEICSHRH